MLQTGHIFSDIINEKTRATGLENFFLPVYSLFWLMASSFSSERGGVFNE